MSMLNTPQSLTGVYRWLGLALGPTLAISIWFFLGNSGLSVAGKMTGAIAVLMACWWLTEAIPLSATALVPLVVFPIAGVLPFPATAAPYASDVIFLFMGGFILGLAMEKSGLHMRVALLTLLCVGTGPKSLVGGIMLASALISMWVSNTATAIMMLPIATSVIALVRERMAPPGTPPAERPSPDTNFESALLLGVAYAASIGGIGTLIGTPPNAVFKGFVETTLQRQVGFADWMKVGVPLLAVYLPLAWLFLTHIAQPIRLKSIPGGRAMIREQLRALGKMTRGEWIVLLVFLGAVTLWVSRPVLVEWGTANQLPALKSINDASIALLASLLLFILPVNARKRIFCMDWKTAERMPWGALILFGGGLSLAAAITAHGLDAYIGQFFTVLAGLPPWLIVLAVVTTVIFASELASNTAIATAILPVLAAAAPSMGIDPIRLLLPATLAASLAFMLPVGTPPNAIVYATGHVRMGEMLRAGFGLNVMACVFITLTTELLGHLLVSPVG